MTEPNINLSEEQQAAVTAGTHVVDPIHGFVPAVPLAEDGTPVQDLSDKGADPTVEQPATEQPVVNDLQQVDPETGQPL